MKKTYALNILTPCMLMLSMCLVACYRYSGKPIEPNSDAVVFSEEALIKLAKADASDGESDHLVAKCITCQLHMAGKPEHAAKAGDYTVQLCSEFCQKTFSEDPAKFVTALNIEE